MNDMRHQYQACSMSDAEYIEALKLRDKLIKQIAEYEDESRRGCLKIIRTKIGVHREKNGFSVRYDKRCGSKASPYWRTMESFETAQEMLDFLSVMARDFPLVYEAFRAKQEETA